MSDYETREAMAFQKQLCDVDKQSLADRKAAAEEFHKAMRGNPGLVAERVGWLLNGSYGYGSYKAAEREIKSRGNIFAWLVQTIGALEWMCPTAMTRDRWKKLTKVEKATLDAAVEREVQEYARDHEIVVGRYSKGRY